MRSIKVPDALWLRGKKGEVASNKQDSRKVRLAFSGLGEPHSLRLRLALWYGALLAVALGVFSGLILVLTMNANSQSVDSAVRAEARIATLNVRRELSPNPPYWPAQVSLDIVDTYHAPGVVIEVLDAQGQVRYRSTSGPGTTIPEREDAIQSALAGQTMWYTAQVDGERVRVEVLPVRAPTGVSGEAGAQPPEDGVDADGAPTGSGPVVGVLLVTKSLSDVDDTLALLGKLLLFSGLAILAGTLVGGWLIATRVLRPLAEIGATARAIATATAHGTRIGNLNQRVRRPRSKDELAQLVDTFNEMLAALERATQAQRRFVADASHELRAPLTTVQGNLAFLQRHQEELPPEMRRTMLADAHAETLRLAHLVDDLLLLARADAGSEGGGAAPSMMGERAEQRQPELPVELDHALLQLVRQLRRWLSAEELQLSLEIGHIEPARVRGDEETIRRVIFILLDNAIKYTPASSGGKKGRITVSLEHVGGEAVVRVSDTGIGIDPEDLPRVFERFYRADRARGRQGTGLGLSIAQMLVERLGGRITVESTVGQGSTFSIWLPLASHLKGSDDGHNQRA